MSTSVRINLLPHRAQKRMARKRQFVSLAVLLSIAALAVVGLVHLVLANQIDRQNNRNKLLQGEIVKLDDQIKEIDKLRDQIQQVLARKQVVEALQSNRNEAVHLLDQMVRQLPDGVYLRSIRENGTKVQVIGYAQSNARVSTLMRNIESSPWITKPDLVEVRLVPLPGTTPARSGDQKVSEFTLNFEVKREAPSIDNAPRARPKAAAARGGKA
jgi:type IV pilus assembly protein PilN